MSLACCCNICLQAHDLVCCVIISPTTDLELGFTPDWLGFWNHFTTIWWTVTSLWNCSRSTWLASSDFHLIHQSLAHCCLASRSRRPWSLPFASAPQCSLLWSCPFLSTFSLVEAPHPWANRPRAPCKISRFVHTEISLPAAHQHLIVSLHIIHIYPGSSTHHKLPNLVTFFLQLFDCKATRHSLRNGPSRWNKLSMMECHPHILYSSYQPLLLEVWIYAPIFARRMNQPQTHKLGHV